MTPMNHPHEASFSHDAAASLPVADWSPLDEIIQAWATFAHATRSAAGLCAVSAAFAALAAESAARHVAVEARLRNPESRLLPDSVLSDMGEARLRWLEALGHLSRVRPAQDEEAAPLIAQAAVQADHHGCHLQALALSLLREPGATVAQPLRVWIGTLPLPDEDGETEEEASQ